MTLAVSNIAWTPDQDDDAHALLSDLGVRALELAPTRWWPDLSRVTPAQVADAQARLARFGLRPVAFQAVLFGQPQLAVFGQSAATCESYLSTVVDLASSFGVSAIVFGSPKQRLRGTRTLDEAIADSVLLWRRLGDRAATRGVRFCLEPNPCEYGADFMTTLAETAAVVRAAGSPGVWLNVDGGELAMNAEKLPEALENCRDRIGHFHISEPYLGPLEGAPERHRAYARALRSAGYDGIVSLEMRSQPGGLIAVETAVRWAAAAYETADP
ncbi:MAG: sugar phosphate isomerase/epimerase [Pedosphaera sp.]|nr:sugar phosphate isomerase/epimerase [Pedosphaera sp.]